MQPRLLDSLKSISIVEIFKNFKFVCDTKRMHEGAAMWILNFFLNKLMIVDHLRTSSSLFLKNKQLNRF